MTVWSRIKRDPYVSLPACFGQLALQPLDLGDEALNLGEKIGDSLSYRCRSPVPRSKRHEQTPDRGQVVGGYGSSSLRRASAARARRASVCITRVISVVLIVDSFTGDLGGPG